MARADLLISLAKAGSQNDLALFRRTIEALIADERAKKHHILADRLAEQLRSDGAGGAPTSTPVTDPSKSHLFEIAPTRQLEDLVLPEVVQTACQELVTEQHRSDLLRSHNLEPRHRILLAGPPGNGKTSLAEALAHALVVPLLTVRYEGLIGSFLGETASRLRQLFDYVRTKQCVLFFDEFDTIGKERGDIHETGEIKRVVSSLLMQMDQLPSYVVVVTASNHPELLDRAVWRRFQLRLFLPQPSKNDLVKWFEKLEERMEKTLGTSPQVLAERLNGISFAEAEDFATDIQRQYVLSFPETDLPKIIKSRLRQWESRFKTPKPESS